MNKGNSFNAVQADWVRNLSDQILKFSFLKLGKEIAESLSFKLTQAKIFCSTPGDFSSRLLSCRSTQLVDEQPLSWELFNLEQLNRHASALAKLHRVRKVRKRDELLARLTSNEKVLLQAHVLLGETIKAKKRISPAGEWILDNFHFIEEQIRLAKKHLPQGYSAKLPQLDGGPSDGHPRVYDIALEIIAHVDGRIDQNNVASFVSTYQQTAPLTLGELWAIPIMLRLALIENLRRVAVRVMAGLEDRSKAEHWARVILESVANDPKNLILVVADMARAKPPLTNSFVAEFTRRLQEFSGLVDIPLAWLDHQFLESGSSIQEKVQDEIQQQAANQVSVSCSIGSLRFLSAIDWREFVQDMSLVEQALKMDPCGVYGKMDFYTRDRYRHVIEDLARKHDLNEIQVAKAAVQLSLKEHSANPLKNRRSHVGYYLIDKGYRDLQRSLNSKAPPLTSRDQTWAIIYFSTILVITLVIAGLMTDAMISIDYLEWLAITAAGLCSSQVGVAIANWLVTLLKAPKILPRLDFSKEVPSDCRTLVVVPTLLFDLNNVEKLIEGLEIRYFGNRNPNVYFALLTDFADAKTEKTPQDDAILFAARNGIEQLNERHRSPDVGECEDRFLILHRPREWNPQENVWMGYERKRGKLEALNGLLRGKTCREGASTPSFSMIAGNVKILPTIKYVITLDTDTQLPRDTAYKLIGAMAHPLNIPHFDPEKRRVTEGYGIMQPRVAINLPSTNKSWFVRLYGGDGGTDPYTLAVSDVYQDLFAEGSFIGKGIYDVDAFTQSLSAVLPTNLILSHDLIEGAYARSGLISDVVLYEEHPSHYIEDLKRRRRWIRGDWQILYWLLPRVPLRDGTWEKNPLSLISRWKIFDNLRRSLVPIATLVVLFLAGYELEHPEFITHLVLGAYFLSAFFSVSYGFLNKPSYSRITTHIRSESRAALQHIIHAVLTLMFVPNDAMTSISSITKSLKRMFFTHKNLLEWRSASDPGNSEGWSIAHFYRSMPAGPIAAVIGGVTLFVNEPATIPWSAMPLLSLWFFAPFVARFLSQDLASKDAELKPAQKADLRRLARKNWRFFEDFVSEENNWLPPDNFQEYPQPVVAQRTSPTNIGLALLANLTAYDFGYISLSTLLTRTEATFRTLDKLERFRGHFYNWYDTNSLKPLLPMYVSTVDSGNFAAHLIILETGLRSLVEAKIIPSQIWQGLYDAVEILEMSLKEPQSQNANISKNSALIHRVSLLKQQLTQPPQTLSGAALLSSNLHADCVFFRQSIPAEQNEMHEWLKVIIAQCEDNLLKPLRDSAPWIELLQELIAEKKAYLSDLVTLDAIPTWRDLMSIHSRYSAKIQDWMTSDSVSAPKLLTLASALESCQNAAKLRLQSLEATADRCIDFAKFEYGFLYDSNRNLLTIGYNVGDHRRDAGFYDLLASEARLISFVGIAQGELPQEHWFSLGRLLTSWNGDSMLLSWSGSMFEYLMPLLVMPTFQGTLLDQTYCAVVQRQMQYGIQTGIPWGVSESGYNATDAQLNYQYKAFGVPGLGFKRGLADDLVIAPYASMMSLMIAPKLAYNNLENMRKLGFEGKYGFYEAIDYTPSRLVSDQSYAIVRSFMAHHQGMGFLSLAYLLLDQPMQKRFHDTAILQATELLLQERVPKIAAFYPHAQEVSEGPQLERDREASLRVISTAATPRPEVHLLSNGRYTVMMTNSGGGYSRWQNMALTRWREDPTMDNWGMFCFVRDVETGDFWSTTYQPTLKESEHYEAIFPPSRAEFRCRRNELELHTEIAVSPEDDIEMRRFSITNLSSKKRVIELTSYAEVILAPQASDESHSAFSNLFVQTEVLPSKHAILCSRRARSDREDNPLMLHLMTVHGQVVGNVSYETDRRQFIGRGRTIASPVALSSNSGKTAKNHDLNGSDGSVLDPIVAIRCRVEIMPEETITANIVTGVGRSREAALNLIEKYYDKHMADRVFELAWTHRQVVLRQLDITESDAQLYARLASSMLYVNPALRAKTSIVTKNRRGQSSLWGYGISGDWPILLIRLESLEQVEVVRQVVRAHSYWRMMDLTVDVIILNEDPSGYRQDLQDQILSVIASCNAASLLDVPGGIYIRRLDQMAEDDRILVQTVARAIILGGGGTFRDQIERQPRPSVLPGVLALNESSPDIAAEHPEPWKNDSRKSLMFANGTGGFSLDGKEYIITTTPDHVTPAPWSNVLANPYFGTVVSESGGSYTWCENAHEFRLSPWYNDALADSSGEAFYIRDEQTGKFWSPTPLPAKSSNPYTSIHGFGYSIFRNVNQGIASELTMFVAIDAPVKMITVKLTNLTPQSRRLSLTGYCEWVLGELRHKSLLHVTTEVDAVNAAILARNTYHPEFSSRIGFFDVSERTRTFTGDRSEFLGRNGSLKSPAALGREKLSGRVGAKYDPCAAMQTVFDLGAGEEREITFIFGVGRDVEDVRTLIRRFGRTEAANAALQEVRSHWQKMLGNVQVETPEPQMDVLVNGWLPYQVISCRLWARSGYYQSGGAFGFRDQLQDAMSLVATQPKLLREQILRCAARQFREGDVQHWWHPPSGRGVRTHFSDDYLWLPLAACRYVLGTGDTGVLDVRTNFIEGRHVKPDEEAYMDLPQTSVESATLYEHCVRAIQYGMKYGRHGLPLIGCGDWNDGMNLVGEHGQGESVWLGFFLYEVLQQFSKVAVIHGDEAFAERCRTESLQLQQKLEKEAWDGEWYRRAYFDSGEPLGSSENSECQIDSLPQSWSVLSGAGHVDRQRQAMAAVERRLIDRPNALIKLFDPPFDRASPNPGYIKGYVPGVRENGGQYTHAAIWTAMAFAALGDTDKAWDLTRMISPLSHSLTPEDTAKYRVEPYVIAADVYAVSPHTGLGGWTWYTGSAAWMYRLVVESLLGMSMQGEFISFDPRLPSRWNEYKLRYCYRNTYYNFHMVRGGSKGGQELQIVADGTPIAGSRFKLIDDLVEHNIEIRF